MEELTLNVNWLAVTVGFVVSFALGWAWYSQKLFGKKWAKGVGLDPDSTQYSWSALITQALGTLLLAWLVGVTAANDALLTIILVIVTFVVLQLSSSLFVRKSTSAIRIEAGYMVAMAVIMIICQGIF